MCEEMQRPLDSVTSLINSCKTQLMEQFKAAELVVFNVIGWDFNFSLRFNCGEEEKLERLTCKVEENIHKIVGNYAGTVSELAVLPHSGHIGCSADYTYSKVYSVEASIFPTIPYV